MSTAASHRQHGAVLGAGEPSFGYWLFRNRSWLPIPLLIAMIVVKPNAVVAARVVAGALIVIAGEALRIWAVQHIGLVSRTRTMRVGPLITSGPYALTRNPLYIGNFLLWTGFALASSLAWMLPLAWLVFGVQHAMVVRWEEHLLASLYPATYSRYASIVPRWWPRVTTVGAASVRYPWANVIFSERGTLLAIGAVALLLVAKSFVY